MYNINRKIDTQRSTLVMEIENTLKNIGPSQGVHPYIEQIVYELKDENNIQEFLKHKIIAKQLGMTIKLILPSDKVGLYKDTEPDYVEVSDLSNELLTIVSPEKIFLRPTNFNEVDSALYNGIYNFSSSLLKTSSTIGTIELITYIRKKLGYQIDVNLETLKETQKEMIDEFNW